MSKWDWTPYYLKTVGNGHLQPCSRQLSSMIHRAKKVTANIPTGCIMYLTSSEDAAPAASFSIRISNPNPNSSAMFRGEAGKGWSSTTGHRTTPVYGIQNWSTAQGGMFEKLVTS